MTTRKRLVFEVPRDAPLLPGLFACVAVLDVIACVPDAEAVVDALAVPLAFARNASKVLPVAGALIARTMPCLQWLAGFVCLQ